MRSRGPVVAIVIIFMLVFGFLMFGSCRKETKEFETTVSQTGGLVAISRQSGFIDGYEQYTQFILYDPDTLVMYSMILNGGDQTITVLYNADGTPKLYDSVNN